MHFIIHELLKEVGGPVRERCRKSLIPPTEREKNFVEEVTRLFRRHQSGRIYGGFETDTDSYPFSRLLRECVSSGEFLEFSRKTAALLGSIMKDVAPATGGYFFAARFNDTADDTLLLFMLSQRTGHAVNKSTLTLESVLNLEMEHLDLAARISVSDWQAGRAEPVSLIRGRKEVSDYFKRFIGLHEPRTNTQATKKLKEFIEQWMEAHAYSADQKETVLERVLEYAKNRGAEAVELRVIGPIVDSDRHEEFFVKANEAGLGAEFHIDRRSLAAWGRIIYSDPDIKLNLARRQMNKRFVYDREKKTLVIRSIELSEEALG